MAPQTFVGTAGWTIPSQLKEVFSSEGTHLQKYAQVLNSVEINSCFYREHKPETYLRWAESVPDHFRFSTKLLKYFTHEKRLKETDRLPDVLAGMSPLGKKWGVLLVQLPPSLFFVARDTEKFLTELRKHYLGLIAWEPRQPTWRTDKALDILNAFDVAKVRADPDPCYISSKKRTQVEGFIYYRLHGTPEMYRSRYVPHVLERISIQIAKFQAQEKTCWCIFDNTTFGYATENALELKELTRGLHFEKLRFRNGPIQETPRPEK